MPWCFHCRIVHFELGRPDPMDGRFENDTTYYKPRMEFTKLNERMYNMDLEAKENEQEEKLDKLRHENTSLKEGLTMISNKFNEVKGELESERKSMKKKEKELLSRIAKLEHEMKDDRKEIEKEKLKDEKAKEEKQQMNNENSPQKRKKLMMEIRKASTGKKKTGMKVLVSDGEDAKNANEDRQKRKKLMLEIRKSRKLEK